MTSTHEISYEVDQATRFDRANQDQMKKILICSIEHAFDLLKGADGMHACRPEFRPSNLNVPVSISTREYVSVWSEEESLFFFRPLAHRNSDQAQWISAISSVSLSIFYLNMAI